MYAVVFTGLVIVVIVLTLLATYNGLMHLRQEIRVAWSGLDEQLKQRYALVSTLTQLSQSMGGEIAAKVPAVIAARNQAAVAVDPVELASAEAALTGALNQLLVAVHDNPAMNSNPQLGVICGKVIANQKLIAQVCARYNQRVYSLNSSMSSFPQVVTAKAMGLRPQAMFNLQT